MRFVCVPALLCFLLGAPAGLQAQGRGAVEIGVDAGVTWVQSDEYEDWVDMDLPIQSLHAGLFVTDEVELESAVRANATLTSTDLYGSFDVGAALLMHFGADPKGARPFVLIGIDWARVDFSNDTDTWEVPKAAVGYRVPAADQWGVRLAFEVRYVDRDNSNVTTWEFGPRVGISVFTK